MAREYEIRNNEGQLFCKCQTGDDGVHLVTKNCSISMQELIVKMQEPACGYRGRMNHKEMKRKIS